MFLDTAYGGRTEKDLRGCLAPCFPRAAEAAKCGTDNKMIYFQSMMCVVFLSSPQLLKLYSVGDT